MAKDPAILMYPGDWLRDQVSGCSIAAQGLWWRMLLVMHDSERRGYLQTNGRPMPDTFIASKCGVDVQTYRSLYQELDDAGVPSQTSEGTIFNRRMVRDEEGRAKERRKKQDQRSKVRCPQVVPGVVPHSVPPLSEYEDDNVTVSVDSEEPKTLNLEVSLESFDGEKWVRRVQELWPKCEYNYLEEQQILQCFEEEISRDPKKKRAEAAEYVAQEVKRIAAVVRKWPSHEKKFIPTLRTVMFEHRYRWENELWERSEGNGTGKSKLTF